MMMPGRGYTAKTGYRYGFGGQERSDEIKGEGNSYTAEFWEYDPRIARRWNVDPVFKGYESPYSTFANNPMWNIDPEGADTAKYLTNKQLVDAAKISFNVIDKDIQSSQYNMSTDRSKELDQGMNNYFNNHKDMTFAEVAEFRENVLETSKILKKLHLQQNKLGEVYLILSTIITFLTKQKFLPLLLMLKDIMGIYSILL